MSASGQQPRPPEGRLLGLPFDRRPLTASRLRSRVWNPDDRHLLTPKAFGWGYTFNLYWFAHPLRYLRGR